MSILKQILIERDGLTEQEAEQQILEAKLDMQNRLAEGEMPMDICEEHFGLEPDYIFELM
jgi:hypothetical protein